VNIVGQQSPPPPKAQSPTWETSNWRKCRVQPQTGCDGNHLALQCARLQQLGLGERREVLEKSGLCMYCLKNAPELECYGRGGPSKPRCARPECGGRHAIGAHKLLGEADACVNLATGNGCESDEDEEWWVNTVRVEEEEENLEELEDPEPEENRERADRYCISTCTRKDDSGLEDELEYFWDAPIPSDLDEREGDRWWSPGPQEPSSEEGKEEVRYLTSILGTEAKENDEKEGVPSPQRGIATSPNSRDHRIAVERSAVGEEGSPELPHDAEPSATKDPKRRRLRKKETIDESRRWEIVRHDAWLRELLTDSSGSESTDEYSRFAESGRWIAKMTGNRNSERRKQEGNVRMETRMQGTTTSRGECSGP
jgi:hypothetical protein